MELCGPLQLEVFYDNGGQREETDLVVLTSAGDLVFQPTIDHPIRTYEMLLCGRLEWYTNIQSCVPFRVKVTTCLTTIVPPPPGVIPSQFNMWYDDEIALDLNDALSQFRREPYCGYEFIFSLKHESEP